MTNTAYAQTDRPDPAVIAAQNDAFRKLACLGIPPAQPVQGRMHVTRSLMEAGDGFMAEAVKATGAFDTRIVTTEQADPSFAFADGMNPFRDTDWMAQRRIAFRDLTGQFYTDILDDVQVLIDRRRGTIRLATDGHSIRVFVRRASDYLIGGTYEVPSGLGGTFRVILKDACDTFAIVQNCGNCEDFDAMQPYRVPLDALMELDDRRAA